MYEIADCGTDAVAPPHFVGESAHIDLVQGRNELHLGGLLYGNLPLELVLDEREHRVAAVCIVCVFLFHFYDCRIWWRVFDLNDQGLNHGVERWLGG